MSTQPDSQSTKSPIAHTPGPWEVTDDFNNPEHDDKIAAISQVADPQFCVAEVCGDVDGARSNAHLIAAAPDLLEALIEAQECLCLSWCRKDINDHCLSCKQATDAIAKAEGK